MAPTAESNVEPRPVPADILKLRLYITGQSPNSVRALANVKAICQEFLGDCQYNLEVVDILLEPLRAVDDGIVATPTLVKLPLPSLQIVGDLSDRDKAILVLGQFRDSR